MSKYLVLFCLFMALLAGCSSQCEFPPKDHILIVTAMDCAKEFGSKPLCLAQCIFENTEMLKDGKFDKTRFAEIIETMGEGETKDVLTVINQKCFQDGEKIEMKQSNCMGMLKKGKCIAGILKKKCPEVLKMFGM